MHQVELTPTGTGSITQLFFFTRRECHHKASERRGHQTPFKATERPTGYLCRWGRRVIGTTHDHWIVVGRMMLKVLDNLGVWMVMIAPREHVETLFRVVRGGQVSILFTSWVGNICTPNRETCTSVNPLFFSVWLVAQWLCVLHESWLGHICRWAHVHTSPYLENGPTHCAEMWFEIKNPLPIYFAKIMGGVHLHVCTISKYTGTAECPAPPKPFECFGTH